MPQRLTVRDEQTGRTITFDWHGDSPPTDADFEEIFAAAGEPEKDWGDTIADALPTVGGMVGGAAGMTAGPGAAVVSPVLAALGGAAGQAGRRVIQGLRGRDVPQGGALLTDLATAGAVEGGTQAVGGAIGSGLTRGARRLYQGLAKPATALRREFPTLIDDALTERIPLTRGGAGRIEARMRGSAQEADALIDAAQAGGAAPVAVRDVLPALRPVVSTLRQRAEIGQPSQLTAVGQRGRRLLAAHPQGIPLTRAQQLKRTAQTAASGAYRAQQRGVKTELSPDDLLDEAVAKGLRGAIERRVPAVAPVNARTQSQIGVDRMVNDALSREGNTLAINGLRDLGAIGGGAGLGAAVGAPGTGLGAGLLLKLLSTPSTGSHAAILAHDAARLGLPTHVLRALMSSRTSAPEE